MKSFTCAVKPLLRVTILITTVTIAAHGQDWKKYSPLLKKEIYSNYKGMYRKAGASLPYPFLTPGSAQYADVLWDWDSWLSNVALRQILLESGNREDRKEALAYEQGCVLNFLSYGSQDGWLPINISRNANVKAVKPKNVYEKNIHKPCLAQHAAFLTQLDGGNAEWLRKDFYFMQTYNTHYLMHQRNMPTGLLFWRNDAAVGVDNDPASYYRPWGSCGSIYLNSMMYKELTAMAYLAKQLQLDEIGKQYDRDAEKLKAAIQENCWDERDGFYYSVDLNLLPVHDDTAYVSHSGYPRDYNCLIQRIGVWSGFMAMWAGIATPDQAKRMVKENYLDRKTFHAPYGIRSLSKMEKMYNLKGSGNPSSWLGPIWGISNYMTWKGLVKYGFTAEAKELAAKTIVLFGRDIEKYGVLHEYYQPDNGEPILNPGFQNWNYLVLNMLAWMEGREVISEF